MTTRCPIAIGLILLCAFGAGAAPAVQNGGFEEKAPLGGPAAWTFGCSPGCDGAIAIDETVKAEGKQSVRLSSTTEGAPNVYCGLAQRIGSLTPGASYRFSLRAKGEDAGACWFGGGLDWNTRYMLPGETFDWQEFVLDWTCPDGVDAFEFRINVDSTTKALWIDDVRVMETSAEQKAAADAAAADKALASIAIQEARLPELEARLAATAQEGIAVPYPRADLAIARVFCGFCREDVAQQRPVRALEVAQEVEALLARAEAEMRKGVDVPVLKKDSPIEIRDGSFWSTCTLAGQERVQPVFLTGYGHFLRIIDDLPLFSQTGINVIQTEIGPDGMVFEDGVRTDGITGRILPGLDRARDNGVRVCILLSPHYFPQWAFQKWPEIAIEKPGFLRNTLDAPQVRDIYRRQIETLIPMVKDHPALHSICLSNEPVSLNSQNDPFRLPLWRAYIERKHKSIETLNAIYGTQYASFNDVPHPRMGFDEKPAVLYDGIRFNQECFAEWHAWMTQTIRAIAPNLPCHAKVMMLPPDRGTELWGTDPWEFAQLSQLNGNDCCFMQAPAGTPWASSWIEQNMYYDLERSMKRVPVFNTENHIIRDREQGHIEGSHIYTAIWQGAVHGQGASTTWVWERTYDRKSDFEGSIAHRAACTAAMSRCALDLMRCAPEVAALQDSEPRVALLYSHAAAVWDAGHFAARARVYEALNFCGIPIGFITDEQIAAGELGRYACLIVPGASHAARDAVEGIRVFAKNGGAVIEYGPSNLTQDEYGRPVDPPPFAGTLGQGKEQKREALYRDLFALLAPYQVGPTERLRTRDGELPYGVEWRSAEVNGRRVINLVDLKRTPEEIVLPDGAWTNLISGEPLNNPVHLDPNTPVLAMSK